MDRLQDVLSAADFEEYLRGGRWSETADDDITGEAVSSEAVERIVRSFNEHPMVPAYSYTFWGRSAAP